MKLNFEGNFSYCDDMIINSRYIIRLEEFKYIQLPLDFSSGLNYLSSSKLRDYSYPKSINIKCFFCKTGLVFIHNFNDIRKYDMVCSTCKRRWNYEVEELI